MAQPQVDQKATGEESEAGPPSSQQGFEPGGCATSMKKPITEYDNTPPRDTPATESQALVAKWMAPRAVRDNRADKPPSRLLSGVMLFRPWDMWIQQASLAQKEGSHPNENRLSRS